MAWIDTKNRNFSNCSEARVRQVIDSAFCELHDSLEEAYYKFWKLGQSKPWFGYDKKANVTQSKDQFDALHGALFHLHTICKVRYNRTLPANERYDESKFNGGGVDELGNSNPTFEDDAIAWLKNNKTAINLTNYKVVRDAIQTKLNFNFLTDQELI